MISFWRGESAFHLSGSINLREIPLCHTSAVYLTSQRIFFTRFISRSVERNRMPPKAMRDNTLPAILSKTIFLLALLVFERLTVWMTFTVEIVIHISLYLRHCLSVLCSRNSLTVLELIWQPFFRMNGSPDNYRPGFSFGVSSYRLLSSD